MQNPKNEIRVYLNKLVYKFLFITGLRKQLSIMKEWEHPNKFETLNEAAYFFRLVSFSFTRSILIELAKLVSDKEQKSIIKFLELAKINSASIFPTKHNKKTDMRDNISSEAYQKIIDSHLNKLSSNKELILNINKRRDKVLAHSDTAYFNNDKLIYEKYPINLDDIDNLVSTIDDILKTHYSYLLESSIDLEVKSTGNVDTLLINTRAFKRVWKDKRIINSGIKPYTYKLDNYSTE